MLQTSLLLMKALNKTETPICQAVMYSLFPKAIFDVYYISASPSKCTFEHAQNVQIHIILHMRKVSSGRLLSIDTLCSIQ